MSAMKRIFLLILAALAVASGADAKRMSDLKIYINPGHGGYTSNDRPIHIYPFAANDSAGYWESKSNLYKGLHMYHILDSLGATPYLSRIKNTEADDRSLSGIAAEANQLGVDLFFSIHSNAGENVNYPLMLYREQTIGTPRYPENITLSNILGNTLYSNKLPVWTHPLQVAGDLTFYQNMWEGGLGVLRTLYTVGLLSEGGMHEHRPECYRLMNDDYWWLEAWHFVHAIMEYFDTEDRFVTGNVAGIVYDDHNLREKDMPVNFHYFGRDAFAPVNGCLIELVDASGKVVQKRTTDQLYNGVFVFRNVAPGNYTLRTSHAEYYPVEASVTVTANEVTYNDLPLAMRREFNLAVTDFKTVAAADPALVSCATTLTFRFNSDIDTESFEKALTIEPAVEGTFAYSENNHVAVFTPATTFEPSTAYTITVGTGARHTDPNFATPGLKEPYVAKFTTAARSRVNMMSHFPADGGNVHFTSPVLELRFDSQVETKGILDHISITDSKGNPVELSVRGSKYNQLVKPYGNALLAISGDLVNGSDYTIRVDRNLRDKEGLPLPADITFSFHAVDVTADAVNETVINDFEKNAPFAYSAEESTGIGTAKPACSKSTTSSLSGKNSARFTYTFAAENGGKAVWKYNGADPVAIESGRNLSMYIDGDFNGHTLYLGLTDGTEVTWVKAADIDFRGWQRVIVPCKDLGNGSAMTLYGLRLDQADGPVTMKGTFYVDDIALTSQSGIADIIGDAVDAPAVYYNLQGIRIDNPTEPGVYIERRGTVSRKVTIP